MLAGLLCSVALAFMAPHAGETSLECISAEEATEVHGMENPLGWYNGDTDTAYVIEGLSHTYTQEVIWHELAHAWDLKKGTELNGFPSFFSETHTGFDLESFARLQTLHLGVWPSGERYPGEIPTEAEWTAMESAGWLMTKEEAR